MIQLYTDGGVCRKNPSPYGLSWAFIAVDENGTILHEDSGRISTSDCKGYLASNNLAEMIAAVKALEWVVVFADNMKGMDEPVEFTLDSDSELTLNRIFKNYSIKKLPKNVIKRLGTALACLRELGVDLQYKLLAGHPTKKDLAQGFKEKKGKRYPVSSFNVYVDNLCKKQAKLLLNDHD
jgi:ribonuclease HI